MVAVFGTSSAFSGELLHRGELKEKQCHVYLGPGYMGNFIPGLNFSLASEKNPLKTWDEIRHVIRPLDSELDTEVIINGHSSS